MTSPLFQDFEERSREVRQYFIFLKSLENGSTKLCMQHETSQGKKRNRTVQINSELIKTLKASGFLLLYNLAEATMRNAIEAIFDEIQGKGISYDRIRPELKKIVLQNIKKKEIKRILPQITNISIDIINVGLKKDNIFSGNIDGRLIKITAQEYGFSCQTNSQKTGNGIDLKTVKEKRNALAHGFQSFAEIGREKSAQELYDIQKKVVKYLKEILENINIYISNKEYLDRPSNTGSDSSNMV
ncbi:MAG: hypothetical protein J7641_21295 [Cyanobacteria bacterium SID2]|nr:hypothetical protein [Cyanobacteria bacterium SID2]MBP0006354.1 hypothetical protein [Cyanobacteria bacterium SBC]